MAQKIDHGIIMTALDYCYNKAINGLPGVDTAEELAREYMAGEGNLKNNLFHFHRNRTGVGPCSVLPCEPYV